MRKSNTLGYLATLSMAVAMGAGCSTPIDPVEDQSSVDPAIADVRDWANNHRGVLPKRDPGYVKPTALAASAQLKYYGGHVIPNVKVIPVFWGPNVAATTKSGIQGFYSAVTNSAHMDFLSEYNTNITPVGGGSGTNQKIGRGTSVAPVTITPSTSATTLTDAAIQTELKKHIGSDLPANDENTYYAIFFPKGVKITMGGSSSCAAGGFCAYHGTISASGFNIYYGIHPDMSAGSGCDTGCGSDPTPFNNVTSVASHELIEAVTDAEVGLATTNGPPLAWYDTTQGEIGDICNASQGSIAGYVVQKEWSNKAGACIVSSGTCTPSCTGKTCGDNGCGGTCGTCPTGQTCSAAGTCTTTCVPSCTGKTCGSNGCGGTCGTCPTGQTCTAAGTCTSSCVPQCTGKTCGSDGCGGTCGTCPSGQTCTATGTCQTTGNTCSHKECTTGVKLTKTCSACATKVCNSDSYCCSTKWDSVCVSEAKSWCTGLTCP